MRPGAWLRARTRVKRSSVSRPHGRGGRRSGTSSTRWPERASRSRRESALRKPTSPKRSGSCSTRAQQAGEVRCDVELGDLFGLVMGACAFAGHAESGSSQARMLSVVCDGLPSAPRDPLLSRSPDVSRRRDREGVPMTSDGRRHVEPPGTCREFGVADEVSCAERRETQHLGTPAVV